MLNIYFLIWVEVIKNAKPPQNLRLPTYKVGGKKGGVEVNESGGEVHGLGSVLSWEWGEDEGVVRKVGQGKWGVARKTGREVWWVASGWGKGVKDMRQGRQGWWGEAGEIRELEVMQGGAGCTSWGKRFGWGKRLRWGKWEWVREIGCAMCNYCIYMLVYKTFVYRRVEEFWMVSTVSLRKARLRFIIMETF